MYIGRTHAEDTLTEENVGVMSARLETSLRKSQALLAQQTGVFPSLAKNATKVHGMNNIKFEMLKKQMTSTTIKAQSKDFVRLMQLYG